MEKTNPLRVAALQLPLVWGDKEGALSMLEAQLSQLRDVSLVSLPEAYLTGYLSPSGDFDLRPFAEPLGGYSHAKIAALAKKFQVAIAAPLIEISEKKFFNSMLFIDETGSLLGHYRKRHPWIPEKWATPGDLGTPVFSWRGLSVTMSICFDLHFIRRECAAELKKSDLLLFSSVWVEGAGEDTRTPQLQKTAQLFSVNIINANWAKSIPAVPSQGGSVIIGSNGETLAQAKNDDVQSVIAEISKK